MYLRIAINLLAVLLLILGTSYFFQKEYVQIHPYIVGGNNILFGLLILLFNDFLNNKRYRN